MISSVCRSFLVSYNQHNFFVVIRVLESAECTCTSCFNILYDHWYWTMGNRNFNSSNFIYRTFQIMVFEPMYRP